jgi:cell division transport system permease protein
MIGRAALRRLDSLPEGERRLLPEGRAAGPMPWVIAVMAFLAALALVAALALGRVAGGLGDGLSRRATVQIVTADAAAARRQADAALRVLRSQPQVAAVRAVPPAEIDRLLAPWLGADAGRALPLPPMIDLQLVENGEPGALVVPVRAVAPDARIDRHDAALAALAGLVTTLRILAIGLVILMAAAMAAVIGLAARAALDTHRATVDILHLLGAGDRQVARLFARRLALDALTGAVAGTLAAALPIWVLGRTLTRLGSDFATAAAPGWGGGIALVLLPPAVAGLATLAARATILRMLARAT